MSNNAAVPIQSKEEIKETASTTDQPRKLKNYFCTLSANIFLISSFILLIVFDPAEFPESLLFSLPLLAVSLFFFTIRKSQKNNSEKERKTTINIALPYFCFLCFIIIQIVPLPFATSRLMGQIRHSQNVIADDFLSSAAQYSPDFDAGKHIYISRNFSGTFRVALLFLAGFITFITGRQCGQNSQKIFVIFLIIAAGILSFAGIANQYILPQKQTLWWFINIKQNFKQPLAGFLNKNHYASFLNLLSIIPLSFALSQRKKNFLLRLLSILFALFIYTGVLSSLSRGGVITMFLVLWVTVLYTSFKGQIQKYFIAFTITTVFITIIIATPHLRQRILTTFQLNNNYSMYTKLNAWKSAIAIWKAYPLLGCGPGALRTVYPEYKNVLSTAKLTHVENEYLQFLAEYGVMGVILFGWLLSSFIKVVRQNYNSSDKRVTPLSLIIPLFVTAVFNSIFDFPLHSPVYSLTLAWFAGTMLPANITLCKKQTTIFVPIIILIITTIVGIGFMRNDVLKLDSQEFLASATTKDIARSLRSSPSSPYSWYFMARKTAVFADDRFDSLTEQCLKNAVRYDPRNRKIMEETGNFLSSKGKHKEAAYFLNEAGKLRSWIRNKDKNK